MFSRLSTLAKASLRAAPLAAALGLGAVAAVVSAPAQAQWHHHHHGPRIGLYFGPGYYYPPPYYYAPPPVIVQPAAPPVYIEQSPPAIAAPAPAPAQPSMWYYCADSRSYYPYVKECAGGWQQVAPQPSR